MEYVLPKVPLDYCLPRGLEIVKGVGMHLRTAATPVVSNPTIIADNVQRNIDSVSVTTLLSSSSFQLVSACYSLLQLVSTFVSLFQLVSSSAACACTNNPTQCECDHLHLHSSWLGDALKGNGIGGRRGMGCTNNRCTYKFYLYACPNRCLEIE